MEYNEVLVIIPCHNEEIAILQTIRNVRNFLPGAQILIVDNASLDDTAIVAQREGATVVLEPRKGKGFAVQRGFAEFLSRESKIALMIDGDDTYSLNSFNLAYELVLKKNYDMVVGTRKVVFDSEETRIEAFRNFHIFGNKFLSKLSRVLLGIDIKDTLSGYRVFSRNFVKSFYGGNSGFEIESELNAHAYIISCSVGNIEVGYRGRPEGSSSKLNTFQDGLKILKMQFRLFKSERPQLAYTLLATPWAILSVILIRNVLVNYFEFRQIPNFPSLIAGVGAFQISILLWITGLVLSNLRLGRVQVARMAYNKQD